MMTLMKSDTKPQPEIPPLTLLRAFIDPTPMVDSIANAHWREQHSEHGLIESLDPTLHGQLTGQICEYFSQQQLLSVFSKSLDQPLVTFAGNIIRNKPNCASALRWQSLGQADVAAALIVNIGKQAVRIGCIQYRQAEVSIESGEAVLMSFAENLEFELLGDPQNIQLVQGYYLKTL